MFDKLESDKKWLDSHLYSLETRRNKIASIMNLINDEINLVMDTNALTFMPAAARLFMLEYLQKAKDDLESAYMEIEGWIRHPDIYQA
tara:strand:+ start:4963 stop:5226 length:264 start_codon:yes stop_codon:yes gene_type:complete